MSEGRAVVCKNTTAWTPLDAPVGHWTTVRRHTQDGHAVFRDGAGRIALADNSGHYPENTDDGILWLDTGHVIEITPGHAAACRLSVRDVHGKEYGTFVTFADALWYSSFLGMVIQTAHGRRYTATERAVTMREG